MTRAKPDRHRGRARHWLSSTLILIVTLAPRAAAQDQALDPLLFANLLDDQGDAQSDVQAKGLLLYRVPLGFHVRTIPDDGWGLRVTFPVSFSALRVEGLSEVGTLVRKALNKGVRLSDLPLDEFRAAHGDLDATVYDVLGVANAVRAFVSYGSTAPAEVERQVERWREKVG